MIVQSRKKRFFVNFPRYYVRVYNILRKDKFKWVVSYSKYQSDFDVLERENYLNLDVIRNPDRTQPMRSSTRIELSKDVVRQMNIKKGDELFMGFVSGNVYSNLEFSFRRGVKAEYRALQKKPTSKMDCLNDSDTELDYNTIQESLMGREYSLPIEPEYHGVSQVELIKKKKESVSVPVPIPIPTPTPEIQYNQLDDVIKKEFVSRGLDPSKSMFVASKKVEGEKTIVGRDKNGKAIYGVRGVRRF